MSASGAGVIDFGAYPGSNEASLDITGQTVVSADWLLSRLDVAEDTTSMLVSATNMGSAPVIKQTITGGTSGGSYLHRPRIITSLGQTLISSAIQVVSTGG